MSPIWLHTASVEVKHRLHNLPQRLVLYQMEVLVKSVNTWQAPPEVFPFNFTNMWVIQLCKGMTSHNHEIQSQMFDLPFELLCSASQRSSWTGCQNVIIFNTRLNMTRLGVCMLASMSALLPAGILSRATLLAGGGCWFCTTIPWAGPGPSSLRSCPFRKAAVASQSPCRSWFRVNKSKVAPGTSGDHGHSLFKVKTVLMFNWLSLCRTPQLTGSSLAPHLELCNSSYIFGRLSEAQGQCQLISMFSPGIVFSALKHHTKIEVFAPHKAGHLILSNIQQDEHFSETLAHADTTT